MGTSCLSKTKGQSCWGFVDRVTFRRYLLRKREGCSGDSTEEEEEGEGMCCTAFYLHATPAPPFPLSRNSSSSWRRAMTGQNEKASASVVRACGWLYLSKTGWVEERKEEPKSSAHETKAKAGPLLPFLFFLTTRQPQLRCN